ncbi:MAG: MarC family protein [Aestuariivirga sp.]|uniref:MarC family protein n=1 Tax=Aestuariivirga sp. TaxID=2650926 RepID=UPI0025C0ACBE|nr:MarC family protein [Aestuariivirga sp.]MCA3562407.1 MarC family protein [Aestuariivirga sp.]
MLADFITSAIATLLVVADPVLLSALFLGITHGMTKEHRREVALRGSIIAFSILLAAGLGGAKLLDLLGISLSAFRIAGGLLLLSAAAEMVFDRRGERLKSTVEQAITIDHVRNIAAFPLAIPLMAGPGAITAMILLAGRAEGRFTWLLSLYGVAALVMAACFVSFLMAERISRLMGVTGQAVLSRLLGIILAALAVQFVIDGVSAITPWHAR